MDDGELLKRYVAAGSEEAFRLLVERNVPLVYSAALRKTNNRSMAEDVTQVVFIILAKKAHELSKGTILAGWLHRTTWHVSMKALVTEGRRRQRELKAVQMQTSEQDTDWESLAPVLDDALAQLGDVERSAVVLRYFQNRSLLQVGTALGISDDAAQKKISRSIDKLRKLLRRRGVAIPVAVFGGLLATRAAQFAPGKLAAQVTPAALRDYGVSTSVYALLEESVKPVLTLKAVGAWAAAAVLGLVVAAWAAGSFSQPAAPPNRVRSHTAASQPPHPKPQTAVTDEPKSNRISESKVNAIVVQTAPPKPAPVPVIPTPSAKVVTAQPRATQSVARAAVAAPVSVPVAVLNAPVAQEGAPPPDTISSDFVDGNDGYQAPAVSQRSGYRIYLNGRAGTSAPPNTVRPLTQQKRLLNTKH